MLLQLVSPPRSCEFPSVLEGEGALILLFPGASPCPWRRPLERPLSAACCRRWKLCSPPKGYCRGIPALEIAPVLEAAPACRGSSGRTGMFTSRASLQPRERLDLPCFGSPWPAGHVHSFTTCAIEFSSVDVAEDWGVFKPFSALIKIVAGH